MRRVPFFIAVALLFLGGGADVFADGKPPQVHGASAILVDVQTGRVLYNKNSREPRAVASTQKLLTALIVAEEGNLWQTVSVQLPDTFAPPW